MRLIEQMEAESALVAEQLLDLFSSLPIQFQNLLLELLKLNILYLDSNPSISTFILDKSVAFNRSTNHDISILNKNNSRNDFIQPV